MSSLYNLEPQPTAKVLLQTTSGDILLELFAKQTPLTSRNFLQLCLDGYYDGTIFHRLVPGFVVQGGDPTGTGEGGEAIYDGGLFADEFHTRLKFNRRGLLGMANSGRKDDNGSQFFLTLGDTQELIGRNTMFGRVAGDTIYNLMKMGEAELMGGVGNEKPMYPTQITGTEILVNPFEDMKKREVKRKASLAEEKKEAKKKSKKKAGKALLSFAGDEEETGFEPARVVKKPKFNTKLVSATNGDTANGQTPKYKQSIQDVDSKELPVYPKPRQKPAPNPETQLPLPNDQEPSRPPSSSPEPDNVRKVSTLLDSTNAQIAELKASMKRTLPKPIEAKKKSALENLIPENSKRGRKRKQGANASASNDAEALSILDAFRTKLDKAPPEIKPPDSPSAELKDSQPATNGSIQTTEADGADDEAQLCDLHFIANCQSCQSWDKHVTDIAEAEHEDDKGWMSHALSFEKDRLGKDLTWRKKNEEELVVIDPREKAKDIHEEQRARKLARKGTSTKAWDKDRDRGRLPEKEGGKRI
ncbi:Peptidyl-prolyl isomerase cwc27 [Loxospora ochrophaea]|nr:Peptidyl-prolyl isomerase cwc27 [Loxospora ochrophaea]